MNEKTPLAMVVGAAGGIGAAVAEARGDRYRLILVDRHAGRLETLVGRIDSAEPRVADVSVASSCLELIDDTITAHGDIDVLVLAAGLSAFGDVATGDVDRWRGALEVNTLSVMYLARAVLPSMLRRGRGHIVVVASLSARATYVGEPAYVASKHAVVAFCECLRKELTASGVRLTVVEPGLCDTPMARSSPLLTHTAGAITPLRPADVALVISFALAQAPNVSIDEVVLRPVGQVI